MNTFDARTLFRTITTRKNVDLSDTAWLFQLTVYDLNCSISALFVDKVKRVALLANFTV